MCSGVVSLTSCVGLAFRGLAGREPADLGERCVVSDLGLDVEPDFTLMAGSSRCLVVGERSGRDSSAACGVEPVRKTAATSNRDRGEHAVSVGKCNQHDCLSSMETYEQGLKLTSWHTCQWSVT